GPELDPRRSGFAPAAWRPGFRSARREDRAGEGIQRVSDFRSVQLTQIENASATRRACSRLWRASAPTAGLALASRPAEAISLQKSGRNRGSIKVQAPRFCGPSLHQTSFAAVGNGL